MKEKQISHYNNISLKIKNPIIEKKIVLNQKLAISSPLCSNNNFIVHKQIINNNLVIDKKINLIKKNFQNKKTFNKNNKNKTKIIKIKNIDVNKSLNMDLFQTNNSNLDSAVSKNIIKKILNEDKIENQLNNSYIRKKIIGSCCPKIKNNVNRRYLLSNINKNQDELINTELVNINTNNENVKISSLSTIQRKKFATNTYYNQKINNNNLLDIDNHLYYRNFSQEFRKKKKIFHKSSTQRLLDTHNNMKTKNKTNNNYLSTSCEVRNNKNDLIFENNNNINKNNFEIQNLKHSQLLFFTRKPSLQGIQDNSIIVNLNGNNNNTIIKMNSRNKIKTTTIRKHRYVNSVEYRNKNKLNVSENNNNFMSTNKNIDNKEDFNYVNNDLSTFISSNIFIDYLMDKNNNNNEIDFDILYILEDKIKTVLNKINNFQSCYNECHNLISYYFSNNIYEKELNTFFSKNTDKKKLIYIIKIKILCLFLCCNISFSKNFNQSSILIKTIFNILHTNYLIKLAYLIHKTLKNNINNNSNQCIIIKKLEEIVKNNLKHDNSLNNMNELNVIKTLNHNTKLIQNYYKIIIDNIYTYYTTINNKNISQYKFPNCLKINLPKINDKTKSYIISIFFFDALKCMYNNDFEQLKKFYYLLLDESIENQFAIKHFCNKNIIIENNYSRILPYRNNKYKYSLILDLDETLIYLQKDYYLFNNNYNIKTKNLTLRPGLIDFLKKMKQKYELILFSFTVPEYVTPIIKIIEEDEKFFEHILYVEHAKYFKDEYIKSITNIGRDIKDCIIVDDIAKMYKDSVNNGICIKPFFGNVKEDKNILQILGNILDKIYYNAEICGDIRKALLNEKYNIITQICSNLDEY